MITLDKSEIQKEGDLLSVLSKSSVQYIKSIIPQSTTPPFDNIVKRHIVHTDPHLDEYFAELLFRSAFPSGGDDIEFIEESLFSKTNDFGAQLLWPEAIIFGIGNTVSYNVKPVLLFDEHTTSTKMRGSCGEVVADYYESTTQKKLPQSIQTLLTEIDAIDAYGSAHQQHLNNIIKPIHNCRFLFSKGGTSSEDIRDFLSPTWKRTLVGACIAAVIYALENNIELIGDPNSKKEVIQNTLNRYIEYTPLKDHPLFEKTRSFIAGNFGNQNVIFNEAILRDAGKKEITDINGKPIPQLLIISRICYACHFAWGETITNIIMTHFYETVFQNQINFLSFMEELNKVSKGTSQINKRTTSGVIRGNILPPVDIEVVGHDKKTFKRQQPVWIFNIVQNLDGFNTHQPVLNFINKNNFGCGIILLEDPYHGTKALFRANSLPVNIWIKLINTIQEIEPDCWYDPSADPNNPAPFILNGTKAHQYIQRSGIDLYSLSNLLK